MGVYYPLIGDLLWVVFQRAVEQQLPGFQEVILLPLKCVCFFFNLNETFAIKYSNAATSVCLTVAVHSYWP